MPPSNTPADIPATGLSLPPLFYYFPPTEPVDSGNSASSPPASSTLSNARSARPSDSSMSQPLLPVPPYFGFLQSADLGSESDGQLVPPDSRQRQGRRIDNVQDRDLRHSQTSPGQRQTYGWTLPLHFPGESINRQNRDRETEDISTTVPPFPMLSRIRDDSPPLPPVDPARSRTGETSINRFFDTLGVSGDSSLRTVFSQSLRRQGRHAQRSRALWQSYAADAERSRERARERDREREREAEENLLEEATRLIPPRIPRLEYVRTGYISACLPVSSHELEETIKYLAKLRSCMNIAESLKLALNSGFSREAAWLSDGSDCKYDDFLLDTRSLKISETSWLNIGGTFWGSQATLSMLSSEHTIQSSGNPSIISLGSMGSSLANTSTTPNKWTVKVNISGVDYKNMRLNGTMEAYADWQPKPSSRTTSDDKANSEAEVGSITTYLEGEIIDFKTHSLQTVNFPSKIKDDAAYWRKLEPFSSLNNPELVKSLTSKKFMNQLMQEYVLMRWKGMCSRLVVKDMEKCFITSPNTSENASLLTIGGFYFLSLRRSDGHIQGFYYDPNCSPYQELKLKPQKRMFPTYEFR